MRSLIDKKFLGAFLLLIVPAIAVADLITTSPGGTFTSGYRGATYAPGGSYSIRGQAQFKSGFTLAAGQTTTWDGDGIVDGPITWSNSAAVLSLKNDLRLGSTGSLVPAAGGGGTACFISGNGNKIIMGCDFSIGADGRKDVRPTTDLTIDGAGHTLTMLGASAFKPNSGITITLKNMTLVFDNALNDEYGVFGSWWFATYVLENVTLKFFPRPGLTASVVYVGSAAQAVVIRGKVAIEAFGMLINLVDQGSGGTITVEKNSTLYIAPGMQLIACNAGAPTFTMLDQTSVLHLNECDFYTGDSGLSLTKGTVVFENRVRIFNKNYGSGTNTNMANAFIFGDGSSASNDVNVRVLSGAYVTLNGCLKYNHS
jgi:hypothetical protein